MKTEMDRLDLVKNVVEFNGDLNSYAKKLEKFPWDFDSEPVYLTKTILQTIVQRYLNRELKAQDIHQWAEFLELRDDVDYLEDHKDFLHTIMHELANPLMAGALTMKRAEQILQKLQND